MPAYDGTGPCGHGPLTGRGKGYCVLRLQDNHSFFEGSIGIEGKLYFRNITHGKEVNHMPRGDGTGPAGMGPMTGRAMGYCAGYSVPGAMNPVYGRGFGLGGGRGGRGRRHWFYATGLTGWQRAGYGVPFWNASYEYMPPMPFSATPEQEMDTMKKQSEYLEKTLADLNMRIKELESEKTKKS